MQFDSVYLQQIQDVFYSDILAVQVRNRMKLYNIAKVSPVNNIQSHFYPITTEKKYSLIYKEGKIAYSIGLWANYRHPEIAIYFDPNDKKPCVEKLFEGLVLEIQNGRCLKAGSSVVINLEDGNYEMKFAALRSDAYKTEVGFAVVFYQWFLDDFNCTFPVLTVPQLVST